jgi:hypothetical protein
LYILPDPLATNTGSNFFLLLLTPALPHPITSLVFLTTTKVFPVHSWLTAVTAWHKIM